MRRVHRTVVAGLACLFSAASLFAADEEFLYLHRYFDVDGFLSDAKANDGTFGRKGYGFVSDQMPSRKVVHVDSVKFGRVRFLVPDTTAAKKNLIACKGQRVHVRTAKVFNSIFILGSAHNGDKSDWIELEFADGSTARTPFGLSDWFALPIFGEEIAYSFVPTNSQQKPRGGRMRLWLQHAPIPAQKKLRAITLPKAPMAKVLAISLGSREGVTPIVETRRKPFVDTDIAVFSEDGFPYDEAIAEVDPERLVEALRAAGLRAQPIGIYGLRDKVTFSATKCPVLVLPYGAGFPFGALDALRRYREAGGVVVHLGGPYRRRCARSPHGAWRHYRPWARHSGWVTEFATPTHDEYLGAARFHNTSRRLLTPGTLAKTLGLEGLPWDDLRTGREIDRGVQPRAFNVDGLPEAVTVRSIITFEEQEARPFAAVFEYDGEKSKGSIDVCLGTGPLWQSGRRVGEALVRELVVRSSAWSLRKKGRIDDETFQAIVSKPVDATPRATRKLVLRGEPRSLFGDLPAMPTKVLTVDVTDLSDTERVLFASAQGLLHRGGETGACAIDAGFREDAVAALDAEGGVESVADGKLADVIAAVGHRRAVVVDPFLHGSLNVATMLSALEGVLITYPRDIGKHELEVIHDLRGRFASPEAQQEFVASELWPKFPKGVLAVYPPVTEAWELRDLLIARRVFTFWPPSPSDRAQQTTGSSRIRRDIESWLAETPVATPVLGYFGNGLTLGIGRAAGVRLLSRHAKPFIPCVVESRETTSETLRNGSLLSLSRRPKAEAPAEPQPVRVERGKLYVALLADQHDAATLSYLGGASEVSEKLSGAPLGVSFDAAALLDLFPGRSHALAGAVGAKSSVGGGEIGIIDRRVFAKAFGPARGDAIVAYHSALEELLSRHGAGYRRSPSGGDLASELELYAFDESLPTAPIVVANPETAQDPLNAVRSSGGTTILRSYAQSELAQLFGPDDSARAVLKQSPLFAVITASDFEKLLGEGGVPDWVELVSPADLARYAKDWTDRFELETKDLFASGSVWRYHDKGEDLGTEWRATPYDDGKWPEGKAHFGYGDDREVTKLSYGSDSSKKHPTYYFRVKLDGAEVAQYDVVTVEFVCDDGLVLYLDGVEQTRYKMPGGDIVYSTHATSAASGSTETRWNRHVLQSKPPAKEIVLAVELHQASATSSDLGFDLRISGVRWKSKKRSF